MLRLTIKSLLGQKFLFIAYVMITAVTAFAVFGCFARSYTEFKKGVTEGVDTVSCRVVFDEPQEFGQTQAAVHNADVEFFNCIYYLDEDFLTLASSEVTVMPVVTGYNVANADVLNAAVLSPSMRGDKKLYDTVNVNGREYVVTGFSLSGVEGVEIKISTLSSDDLVYGVLLTPKALPTARSTVALKAAVEKMFADAEAVYPSPVTVKDVIGGNPIVAVRGLVMLMSLLAFYALLIIVDAGYNRFLKVATVLGYDRGKGLAYRVLCLVLLACICEGAALAVQALIFGSGISLSLWLLAYAVLIAVYAVVIIIQVTLANVGRKRRYV